MNVTDYIARFAEFFSEIIKMFQALFAKLSGSSKPGNSDEDAK